MKYPYEYWLKYLIISGMSRGDIDEMTALYGFTPPEDRILDRLEADIDATKPKPFRKNSKKVVNWLRRQRVWSLYDQQKYAVEARNLLGEYKVRRALEFLLIADTPVKECSDYLRVVVGRKINQKVLKFFAHYFWNRDLLTLQQWERYLKERPPHPYAEDLLNAYDQGTPYALWKIGYREEVPNDVIVKSILHEATMRFFETSKFDNNRNTALTAKMWSETVFRALEELDKSGDAVQEILEELKGISIKLDDAPAADINELTGGNFSKPTE